MMLELLATIQAIAKTHGLSFLDITPPFVGLDMFDYGLRRALEPDFDFTAMGNALLTTIKPPLFLPVEDYCCYHFALSALPQSPGHVYLLGPWVTGELPEERKRDFWHLHGKSAKIIFEQYNTIPCYANDEPFLIVGALMQVAYPEIVIEMVSLKDYAPFRANTTRMQHNSAAFIKELSSHQAWNIFTRTINFIISTVSSHGNDNRTS